MFSCRIPRTAVLRRGSQPLELKLPGAVPLLGPGQESKGRPRLKLQVLAVFYVRLSWSRRFGALAEPVWGDFIS